MCNLSQSVREKGYHQGKMKAAIEIATKMLEAGYEPEMVASLMGWSWIRLRSGQVGIEEWLTMWK